MPLSTDLDTHPHDAVEVYRSVRARTVRHRALVLRAMGIPNRTETVDGVFRLFVDPGDAPRAREQIALYESENRTFGRHGELRYPYSRGVAGALVYAALLCGLYLVVYGTDGGARWLAAGSARASVMRAGAWWRAATALGLHADLAHLAGNLVFGALFGAFLSQVVGTGVAWATALLAGTLGNALNALVQRPDHASIGASTAVFGALGALVSFQWLQRRLLDFPRMRRWTPLWMGVLLLGFLGVSGENTDVVAHVTGFGSGLTLGAVYGAFGARFRPGTAVQAAAAAAALLAFAVAWVLALRA